jgi:hypothetical protein
MAKAPRPTPAQLKLLRRALRERLSIDTGLTKKKKKEEATDPDEELAAKGKVARKGYASSVSARD